MIQRIFLSLIILCQGFVMVGCASTGAKTGYLQNYGDLKRGTFLEGFYVSPEAASANTALIQVGEIDTSKTPGTATYSPSQAANDLRGALKTAVQRHDQMSRYRFDGGGQANAQLDIAITEINPGSRAGRFFAAELGAGHAYVQVEGKLSSVPAGIVLATFSEKRRSSGLAGTLDMLQDAGPILMKQMLDGIAADIIQEIKKI